MADGRVNERRRKALEVSAETEDREDAVPVVERAVTAPRQQTGGHVHWFSR